MVKVAGAQNNPAEGIFFILLGMGSVTMNDAFMKLLSGGYPLHQLVFIRSMIGISLCLVMLRFEGGFTMLKTRTPGLHLLRGLMIVCANMAFFTALSALPLGTVTSLFFVAPLFITLLSIPFLGEKVGPRRIGAVLVGFLGVLVMVRPGSEVGAGLESPLILLLPVVAAMFYAGMQIMTRSLGVAAPASVLAIYMQLVFLVVGACFWLVAGDGRYAEGVESTSLQFLLRAWTWPQGDDVWLIAGLGLASSLASYCLSRAYKAADAATVAPFEYVALPIAILWGWALWGDLPTPDAWLGVALIMGAGLYVFLRERRKSEVKTHGAGARR